FSNNFSCLSFITIFYKKIFSSPGKIYFFNNGHSTNAFCYSITYQNQPSSFQELLFQAKEEYGFEHLMGGLTIPSSLFH
ncbi:auxin-induced protein x15, partial [Phtheirospermum japonicum]